MWKTKNLKSLARKSLKSNYARAIAVCFIIACLTSAYSSSLTLFNKYDTSNEIDHEKVVNTMYQDNGSEVVTEMVEKFIDEHPDATTNEVEIIVAVDVFVDSVLTAGSISASVLKIINNMIVGKYNLGILIIILGFLIKVLYNIFISSTLQQGERRFFIENRRFNNTKIPKLFFLFRLRQVRHTAGILLKKWFFNALWWFTIVGGIFKYYEYRMIPYILAENPEIKSKDAFALSKEMMKGNKWKTFLFDCSFIGWYLLGLLTLGLALIFYVNPYKSAALAELYMTLRNKFIKEDKGMDIFTDVYLDPTPEFVIENNGVYPYEKYIIPQKKRTPINAKRKYTITSLILLFFIFSFVGWCYEVGIHIVLDGVFVNRGTMHGPWLPIYGSGGVLVVLFMRRWMDKPIVTFFATMVICSIVEYFTSWYLEVTRGIRWWDYSGYFMNLNGRICLLGATVFGIGGCAFLYYIAPRLDDLLCKIPRGPKISICVILLAVFGIDAVYSQGHPNVGAGITDYGYAEQPQKAFAKVKLSELQQLSQYHVRENM